MSKIVAEPEGASPFHEGEQALQSQNGLREEAESMGRRMIRSFMPDQHRDFFSQLPFLVVGAVDDEGWPWASLFSGRPGFMQSPDPLTLEIASLGKKGDPVRDAIRPGAPLGLLGIEMHSRRRNRLNGRVSLSNGDGFTLAVDQSFGNCPQYIRHRSVDFLREPGKASNDEKRITFTAFDQKAKALIGAADVFFVSSYISTKDNPLIEGVDVSHRGGRAGFVKLEGDTLTIPDFPGNNAFNTLGNFLINPKAGLVFPNFETGDLLMLTGKVELLDEDHVDVMSFKGAERAWRFILDHGFWLEDALPFRSSLGDISPNSLLTDSWAEAEARKAIEAKRQAWREFRLARIEDESSIIRSFYLQPVDGDVLLPFEAGQFLTIRITPPGAEKPAIRTYTVSSAPADPYYRISVKREDDGLVSRHLHDGFQVGDIIEAKAPAGDFFIDAAEKRPAVLIAGGVGVTPMISMARHVVVEGLRIRHLRPLTIFHAAQTTEQRAFYQAFRELEQGTNGAIRYYSMIDQPAADEKPGVDFNGSGYITADILKQTLPLDDYDFFLCGPPPFMQALYDTLRGLGVRDIRIFAEAFGPASLKRLPDEGAMPLESEDEAEEAVVSFTQSGIEQTWEKGGATLLELAEDQGLNPDFGCRKGSCGTCLTKLKSGTVAYRTKPSAEHASDKVLICCAVPAEGSERVELEL